MAHYRGTVLSLRSPEDTFDYLARFSSAAQWDPSVGEAEDLDPGPVGIGSRFRIVVKTAGLPVELRYEVVEYERPDRVRLIAETATFTSDDTIVVRETATGTEVTYDADVRLKGPLRLFDLAMRVGFSRVAGRAREGLQKQLSRPRETHATSAIAGVR